MIYTFAAAFALLVCLGARPLGRRLGLMDLPDGCRKLHARPTPLVGGLAVIPPVVIALLLLSLDGGLPPEWALFAMVIAAVTVLGAIDDRRHLRPVTRLSVTVALFLVCLASVADLRMAQIGFTVPGLSDIAQAPLPGLLALLFPVLCLTALQVGVNMADGDNGLVIGLSLVWTVLLASVSPGSVTPVLMVLLTGLAIALPFNWQGRLFLGDAGTYGLAAVIGGFAIYAHTVGAVAADTIVLWFLIPMVDCARVVCGRIMAGGSPFQPDRTHLHHLLRRRMSRRRAVLLIVGVSGLTATCATLWPSLNLVWAGLALGVYGAMVLAGTLNRAAVDSVRR